MKSTLSNWNCRSPGSYPQHRDSITLWKGADPDIPILKQAKAEYGKLQ
jgi:hypothetical protein